jgi:pre-rRNA-processing protein TSR4
LSSPPISKPAAVAGPPIPWPVQSSFPTPYPHYYLDADYETLSRPSTPKLATSAHTQSGGFDDDDAQSSSTDPKDTFESALDKPFHRFSTRLTHNPEQVLRYEFRGSPLLYSTNDAIGKLFRGTPSNFKCSSGAVGRVNGGSRIPRCESCGVERVFEVQLVPHAISVLEEGREGIGFGPKDNAGMEWGTVILGVCAADCGPEREGEVGWREEWVGVQWEERAMGN